MDYDTTEHIKGLLEEEGYEVVVGYDRTVEAVMDLASNENSGPLCSGYGVLPNGSKCEGCKDCQR